jgi:hypothetical protein
MSIWDFFKPKPTPKPEIIVGLEGAVAVDKLAKVIKIEEFAEYGPEHNEIKRKIQSPIATDGDYHSMVKRKAMESKKATDSFLTDYKSIMVRTK